MGFYKPSDNLRESDLFSSGGSVSHNSPPTNLCQFQGQLFLLLVAEVYHSNLGYGAVSFSQSFAS